MAKKKTVQQTDVKPKRKNSKAKGGAFERDVAKRLSLWYSNGKRDDVFYRTASSGGRATMRFKKGQHTANAAGDLSHSDSVGETFLKCVAVEIKSGYKNATIGKMFSAKQPELVDFFEQAHASATQAGVPNWLVIHKQDYQPEMVYMNLGLFNQCFGVSREVLPEIAAKFPVPVLFICRDSQTVSCFRFDDFLTLDANRFVL